MPIIKTAVEQAIEDFIDVFDEIFFEKGPLSAAIVKDARRRYVALRIAVGNESQQKLIQYLEDHPEEMKLLELEPEVA